MRLVFVLNMSSSLNKDIIIIKSTVLIVVQLHIYQACNVLSEKLAVPTLDNPIFWMLEY